MDTPKVKPNRRFSWLQFDADARLKEEAQAVALAIDPDHLSRDGIEDDTHVTVLYGLMTDDPNEVFQHLKQAVGTPWSIGRLSVFSNKKEDVLKFSVISPELMALNTTLRNKIRHHSTFGEYNPHVTVARLRKGFGVMYVGLPTPRLQVFSPSLVFHTRDRKRFELPLGVKTSPFEKFGLFPQ